MRIRWKLTILLLAVSLVPLVTLKVVDGRAIRRLSDRVVDQVTATVSRRVEHELLQHVHGAALRMEMARSRAELVARTQAEGFTEALAQPPSRSAGPPAWATPAAFKDGGVAGLRPQPGWPVGAEPAPMVSYDRAVVLMAGGEPNAASADALSSRVGLLRALSDGNRARVRSQFVCLENGVHLSFPGKDGHWGDFDGRQRPWYTNAVEAGGIAWTGPYLDTPTGEPRLTCSFPLKRDDGTLLGVTGVDLSLDQALSMLALPPDLSLGASSVVVMLDEGGGAKVVLRQSDRGDSVEPPEPTPLTADDPSSLAHLIDDLSAGRDGVMQCPYQGEPCVWAYGSLSQGMGVVMIVPSRRVDAMVEGTRQDLRSLSQDSIRTTAAAAVIVVLLVLASAYLLARTIARPIRRLADAAEAVRQGDLAARVRIKPRRDEIGKLARTFDAMVPALADRLRLRESLALANELQQGLLPKEPPQIPGHEVFGVSHYCDETGGDYYDYLQPVVLGDGRFGLVVGDVTGHGVPAALVMTSVRALLQSHAGESQSPGELLGIVNTAIARDADQGRFITLQLVVLDTRAGEMHAANAGHDPGLIFRAESGVFDELPLGGLPLGVDGGERYATEAVPPLAPGDVLVIGTDGIWETRDKAGRFYGKERLREAIREHTVQSPREIGEALLADLDTFRAGAARLDDVTFVIVKGTGAG
ncbi:MAG: SpoIIE family protein phosphatase [Phycisphaeraceae bacterium]|nr:MAG: SpoIIE family protein phosphatase [Phycisphaeraceae bacterium]